MPRRVLNTFNEQTHFIFKFCYISGAAKDLKLCPICKLLVAGRTHKSPGSEQRTLLLTVQLTT